MLENGLRRLGDVECTLHRSQYSYDIVGPLTRTHRNSLRASLSVWKIVITDRRSKVNRSLGTYTVMFSLESLFPRVHARSSRGRGWLEPQRPILANGATNCVLVKSMLKACLASRIHVLEIPGVSTWTVLRLHSARMRHSRKSRPP